MITYYADMGKIHRINILTSYYRYQIYQKQYGALWYATANQNISSSKSALWYATADLIVVKDGIMPCVSNVGHR